MPFHFRLLVTGLAVFFLAIFTFAFCTETVRAGHEAAGTYFGRVLDKPLTEGFHFVNPIVSYTHFDMRNQAYNFDHVSIPTESDQMTSHADITVQYRLAPGTTPNTLQNTGDGKRVDNVILVPSVRNVIRVAARKLGRAEALFNEEEVALFQTAMVEQLTKATADNGIIIDAVLVRNVNLPQNLVNAINAKKEREQEVEKQRAELERVRLEQEQKVTEAEAAKNAAEFTKQKKILLAEGDAEADRIKGKGRADQISMVKRQLGKESYNDYIRAQGWNGQLPKISSGEGAGLFLQIAEPK